MLEKRATVFSTFFQLAATFLRVDIRMSWHVYIETILLKHIWHWQHIMKFDIELVMFLWGCLLPISMLWHRQAIFELKWDKLSSSAECRIRTRSPAHWMPADKPTELSRFKLKLALHSPSLWSAIIQHNRLSANGLWYLALAIYMFVVVMLCYCDDVSLVIRSSAQCNKHDYDQLQNIIQQIPRPNIRRKAMTRPVNNACAPIRY